MFGVTKLRAVSLFKMAHKNCCSIHTKPAISDPLLFCSKDCAITYLEQTIEESIIMLKRRIDDGRKEATN